MSSEGLNQYECTALLLDVEPEAVFVSNLGIASYVLAGVEDREKNFYLWGSMGVTTPVGLGLSMAVDDPVTVLDGDGSLLMSLGALSTVGAVNSPNLTIVVWDNEEYVTVGGQTTHSGNVDFVAIARECGLDAVSARTMDELEHAYSEALDHDGTSLIVCDVEPMSTDDRPPLDPSHIKRRVRSALGDE